MEIEVKYKGEEGIDLFAHPLLAPFLGPLGETPMSAFYYDTPESGCAQAGFALRLRREGPDLIACPTCGRTKIDLIPLAQAVEERLKTVTKPITVAVMGCPVNGPGEAAAADVGIAGGNGKGILFRHGEVVRQVPQEELLDALMALIEEL